MTYPVPIFPIVVLETCPLNFASPSKYFQRVSIHPFPTNNWNSGHLTTVDYSLQSFKVSEHLVNFVNGGKETKYLTNQRDRSILAKRSIIAFFALSAILLVTIGIGQVSADFTATGTEVVGNGQGVYLTIYMATDGPLPFTVDVYSGPNIDIILVDSSNFQLQESGKGYTYYQGGTFFDSSHAVGNAYLTAGTYYLIFNNPYKLIGGGSATVHYSYTPSSFTTGSTLNSG